MGNLKFLARFLGVSVDYLLDDTEVTDELIIREPYNLAAYGRGCRKVRKDRVVRDKFPDAKIYTLFGRQKLACLESVGDNVPDCRSGMQTAVKNSDRTFYLVEKEGYQFFVTVTDHDVIIRPLEQPLRGNGFSIDGWNFIKCNYEIGV